MDKRHLYIAFQSSQIENPQDEELKIFQNKYKKDFKKRELYNGEELETEFRLQSWRNPLFSEITSIIIAYESNGQLRMKYIDGKEVDVLTTFVNLLKNNFQEYQLVCFDAEIILPYLGVRLNRNGFINPVHQDLKYFGSKSWALTCFDLKAYYKGAGRYSYSLEEIAYILNIDAKGIIPYDEEFNHYASGDFESLKVSAIKKLETIAKIHKKLVLLQSEEIETVLAEEKVENVEVQKPTDFLKELYYNGMTEEVKQGLKQQIFGGKKPLKKELEHLFTIIRGVYVQTSFETGNMDSKATIEKKESEIKQLLGL
jgi:hypothetical protein